MSTNNQMIACTSDTDSETETGVHFGRGKAKQKPKVIILSDVMLVPPASKNTDSQKNSEKRANNSGKIVSKRQMPIEKPKRKTKKALTREPMPSSKSVTDKTSMFVPKTSITAFATKTSSVMLESSSEIQFVNDSSSGENQISLDGLLLKESGTITEVNDTTECQPSQQFPSTLKDDAAAATSVLAEISYLKPERQRSQQCPSTSKDSVLASSVLAEIGHLKRQQSDMISEIRKGFGKRNKPDDKSVAYIKRILPCKSVPAFDSLDNELVNDPEFYVTLKRYLRNFRGVPDNSNYYGSVLSRIVDDSVVNEYNFDGVKEKFKLDGHSVVELLFDVYKETDRILFEKKMRATIRFAKNRFHNGKSDAKKKLARASAN